MLWMQKGERTSILLLAEQKKQILGVGGSSAENTLLYTIVKGIRTILSFASGHFTLVPHKWPEVKSSELVDNSIILCKSTQK